MEIDFQNMNKNFETFFKSAKDAKTNVGNASNSKNNGSANAEEITD